MVEETNRTDGTPPNFLVRLRPRGDTLHVSQSRTVLATERDGFIDDGGEHGLFVYETRLLSRYRFTVNGQALKPVALSNVEQHSWLGYYITVPPGADTGDADTGSGMMEPSSQQTLELRLSRYVGDGVHEDVDLTNYSREATRFSLELEVDADFADVEETSRRRRQHGEITRLWRDRGDVWALSFDYRAGREKGLQARAGRGGIHRGVLLRVGHASSAPRFDREGGRILFDIQLDSLASWHCCIDVVPFIDGKPMEPAYGCRSFRDTQNEQDRRRRLFLEEATSFTTRESATLAPVVVGSLEQAKRDLAALRLYDLDLDERAWTMAAGLPIYVALFGRDVLTAAWQASMVDPGMLRGTLAELANWQGRERDDWRDEMPGRMIHEAHTGPLSMLDFHPRRRYYGSVTTSGFYPVAVAELWHWTGDRELVRPLIAPAIRALRYLDRFSDRSREGFYQYKTRSRQGVKHQAWKDSPDAIVDEYGHDVEPPIAACEEQGFVYLAKLHLSEVLWWLDEAEGARSLYDEASELKKRFNEAFWMEEEGFFAMGLGPDGRHIRSIGSNPGHCLATAIADESLVERTARRLMMDDMFSGWGVRTLSSRHPAYNPYSYHRGSVWPVENATFALAFMRYGLHDELERLARAQYEAAALFDFFRLPEVFSGHARDHDHPFPAFYPQANSPQAWSASAVFTILQSLLGLYPYAPLRMLLVDPHLPAWLPEITLKNLRVGDATVTLRFFRDERDGTSDYEVLDKRGRLHVLRQPSPWSLTAGFAERLRDALSSFLPGR